MTSPAARTIICIGSLLWDFIGRSSGTTNRGADVPGRITRVPGGVAMNVASTLRRYGAPTTLLSAIGLDPAGEELAETCREMGIGIDFLHHSPDLPTDRYMAIEDLNGLVSAVADVHTLESSGDKILRPLSDGRLGTAAQPWEGLIVLDGNLTESLLAHIATSPLFACADLRVAPASPGKVERLRPLLTHPRLTLYANLHEARLLAGTSSENAATAATALIAGGVRRVLVTDGERECVDGQVGEPLMSERPPEVRVKRITGAGDTFMAAHIAAERNGSTRQEALSAALRASAAYVSGEIGS
jgi:sugar/nucleoside kinase (ribokinase family)